MTVRPLLGLSGLAAILVGLLFLEYQGARPENATLPASSPPPAARPGAPAAATSNLQMDVANILRRPLFAANRRSAPAGAAAGASTQAVLPRLTGVLVSASGRSLIFASEADGKPVIVAEGGQIGRYRVQSISAGKALVIGPDGARTLHPSFTRMSEQARGNAPSQPSILDMLRSQPMSVGIPGLTPLPAVAPQSAAR